MGMYLKMGSAMAKRKLPITFLLCGIILYTLVVFFTNHLKTLIFYLTHSIKELSWAIFCGHEYAPNINKGIETTVHVDISRVLKRKSYIIQKNKRKTLYHL